MKKEKIAVFSKKQNERDLLKGNQSGDNDSDQHADLPYTVALFLGPPLGESGDHEKILRNHLPHHQHERVDRRARRRDRPRQYNRGQGYWEEGFEELRD